MKKSLCLIMSGLILLTATGCAHQHKFSEATCTEPEICEECGEERGEPLGHIFADATCTEPQTCKECGKTQGEALGHEVTFGKCGKCGEAVGKEDLSRIISLTIYSKNRDSASDYYDAGLYDTCYSYVMSLQKEYSEANDIAKQYPEMSKLSGLLKQVATMEFDKSDGSQLGDIFFMGDYCEFLKIELDIFDELKLLQDKLA